MQGYSLNDLGFKKHRNLNDRKKKLNKNWRQEIDTFSFDFIIRQFLVVLNFLLHYRTQQGGNHV